jgi:D-sedoheptulose 7-phosphate isomerase
MLDLIKARIQESIEVKNALVHNELLVSAIDNVANACVAALKNGGKILLCGNGGSAADAQHIAAELSGRFKLDRDPLFAEALHVNTSYLTATANDYSFDVVYARLVQAMGRKGDVIIGLSTSGSSVNVLKALKQAKEKGMVCIGFTGERESEMGGLCDHLIMVPSGDTARIQEGHILVGHIVCEIVEKEMFSSRRGNTA